VEAVVEVVVDVIVEAAIEAVKAAAEAVVGAVVGEVVEGIKVVDVVEVAVDVGATVPKFREGNGLAIGLTGITGLKINFVVKVKLVAVGIETNTVKLLVVLEGTIDGLVDNEETLEIDDSTSPGTPGNQN
jgi:hypothetical protein